MKKFMVLFLILNFMLALIGCTRQNEFSASPTGYSTGTIQQPQIMYNGQVYFYFATGMDEALPDEYEFAGSISAVDNDNEPTEDFHGARVELGQEIYASKVNTETIYVKYEKGYAKFAIKNRDTVQNEQKSENGAYPPCVKVDGVIYKDTGYVASMPGCGTMDGEIVSAVEGTELPSENDQSNFGSGYQYQRSSEGQIIVVMDGERIIFRDIEKDDTSIAMEVIHFNAEVREITEDGSLLVTHVSTAEGFQMNGGEYDIPTENLVGDVQVGDLVTIWFNGMIQETDPAQLGMVYRVIKAE